MDSSLPIIPPPTYYNSESHPQSSTYEQMLQHIPTPQPQHLSASPEPTESKWARRSLSSHTNTYIPSSPPQPQLESEPEPESKWARRSTCSTPWPQDETFNFTESARNYRNESRKKFILFVVAILVMLAAMLAIVGATTHFRIKSNGCNMQYYNGSWVCVG